MSAPEAKILKAANALLAQASKAISHVVLGKDAQIRLALTCLVARGHLLIEDLPGVGKTTLAHTLAQVMGLDFKRIQFTADMLPADVLGVSIYEQQKSAFQFHAGPVFTHCVLADEVNRATPKTQSALLEAMEEHQVTVEGDTHALPKPFFVIATQNPEHHIGTYALPESQLDRFLMRLRLGFPDREAERALLSGIDRRELIDTITPVIDAGKLVTIQQQAAKIHVAGPVLDYVQAILEFTRQSPAFSVGLSPRGGLGLVSASKALALIDGYDYVIPEHVREVLPAVVDHRLHVNSDDQDGVPAMASQLLLASVAVT